MYPKNGKIMALFVEVFFVWKNKSLTNRANGITFQKYSTKRYNLA
jgi:hypothetical protein